MSEQRTDPSIPDGFGIPPRISNARAAAVRWGRLGCGAALLSVLLGEVAGGVWPMVLLTPYTPQWAVIGLLGAAVLAAAVRARPRRVDRGLIAAALLAAAWGGVVTFGLVPWRTLPPATFVVANDPGRPQVKILSANVHSSNKDHRALLELIAAEQPDVILLTEVNDAWLADLQPLNDRYAFRRSVPDATGNFGISVWSRLPSDDAEFVLMKPEEPDTLLDVPQFDATFVLTDRAGVRHPVRFVGLHPLTPTKPAKMTARDTVLATTARSVAGRVGIPTIVAGDFNATRYCRVMQSFNRAGLADATSRLRFSWPNTWSWWAMGIRIDHVLVSQHWQAVDVRHGRDIGSDHLPLVATLRLAGRP